MYRNTVWSLTNIYHLSNTPSPSKLPQNVNPFAFLLRHNSLRKSIHSYFYFNDFTLREQVAQDFLSQKLLTFMREVNCPTFCGIFFKRPVLLVILQASQIFFSFCVSHLGPAEESSWPVFSLPLRLEGRSVVRAGLQTLGKGSSVFCCPCLLLGEVHWQKGKSEPLLRSSCSAHVLLPHCGNPDFLALPLGCHHVCREVVSFS